MIQKKTSRAVQFEITEQTRGRGWRLAVEPRSVVSRRDTTPSDWMSNPNTLNLRSTTALLISGPLIQINAAVRKAMPMLTSKAARRQ